MSNSNCSCSRCLETSVSIDNFSSLSNTVVLANNFWGNALEHTKHVKLLLESYYKTNKPMTRRCLFNLILATNNLGNIKQTQSKLIYKITDLKTIQIIKFNICLNIIIV